jgi:pyruvate ferredoxin oxidoreductase delta subunit
MRVPITIAAKPGSSRVNRTGSWRTGQKPKFLQKNCIACRLCVLVCPEGIISGKEKNSFHCDYDYCKGCGNCAAVCPKADITMVPEEEEV